MDITTFESYIFESKLNHLLGIKEVDDYLLTGKPGAVRDAYRCCDENVAEVMIGMAGIKANDNVLEPGAGKGMILKKLTKFSNHYYCEISKEFVDKYLKPLSQHFLAPDFLSFNRPRFHKIIMNPPFSFQQYAEHILHAYSLLVPGGTLVALYPKKAKELRISNYKFLQLLAHGESTDVGNVCGEDTSCVIFKIVKP